MNVLVFITISTKYNFAFEDIILAPSSRTRSVYMLTILNIKCTHLSQLDLSLQIFSELLLILPNRDYG